MNKLRPYKKWERFIRFIYPPHRFRMEKIEFELAMLERQYKRSKAARAKYEASDKTPDDLLEWGETLSDNFIERLRYRL